MLYEDTLMKNNSFRVIRYSQECQNTFANFSDQNRFSINSLSNVEIFQREKNFSGFCKIATKFIPLGKDTVANKKVVFFQICKFFKIGKNLNSIYFGPNIRLATHCRRSVIWSDSRRTQQRSDSVYTLWGLSARVHQNFLSLKLHNSIIIKLEFYFSIGRLAGTGSVGARSVAGI